MKNRIKITVNLKVPFFIREEIQIFILSFVKYRISEINLLKKIHYCLEAKLLSAKFNDIIL